MEKKLFVGNLAWKVREDDLSRWLEEKGVTCEKVEVVLERDSDRSRGFGFLHFATEEAAAEAKRLLDDVELDGRAVHVEEAAPSGRSAGGRSGRGGGGGRPRGEQRRDDGDARGGGDRRRTGSRREW